MMRCVYVALCAVGLMAMGCDGGPPDAPPRTGTQPPTVTPEDRLAEVFDGYAETDADARPLAPEWQNRLDARVVDYGEALRVASLRFRGDLPSMGELRVLASIDDPALAYEQHVDAFLEDPRFLRMLYAYFRDTFRMGGGRQLNSAAAFAAQVVFSDQSFTQIFTAASGTCPMWSDGDEGPQVEPGDCDNGVGEHAGLLTHPGVMEHFGSNLAFRRVRWLQETFACRAYPAEFGTPTDVGGPVPYSAPWEFLSIAGEGNGGRIDFHDVESAICANCHATMNHLAPLFARFDPEGQLQEDFAVTLPLDGFPTALRTDWLPEGESTAWRFERPVESLRELGVEMAVDDEVIACTVARVWNWAFGHGDAVTDLELVPASVTRAAVTAYRDSGFRLKAAIRAIALSPDFVRY